MAKPAFIRIASLVALALAWLAIYRQLHPAPPSIDPKPHRALGQWLAARALESPIGEARLTVLARDPRSFQVPAEAAQLAAFQSAIHQAGRKIHEIRWINLDPLRISGVPPGDFFDLLRQSRPQDVIVSFLGPPALEEDQFHRLGPQRPRVLAVCSGSTPDRVDLPQLFENKLLAGAIVSRRSPPPPSPSSSLTFDQMFQWITSANATDLPRPSPVTP